MSKSGGYRGGSTILRPGSGWFSYAATDKTARGKKTAAQAKRGPTTALRPSLAAHAALARREAIAARAQANAAKRAADAAEQIARDKEARAERLSTALKAGARPTTQAPAKPTPIVRPAAGKAVSRTAVKTQVKAGKSAGRSAPVARPAAPRSYKAPSRAAPGPAVPRKKR